MKPTVIVAAVLALATPAFTAQEVFAQTEPAPAVQQGDRNQLTAWWQDRLNTWLQLSGSQTGPLVVDGFFGPNTEAATFEFQNAVEVPADGVVDPEDRVALSNAIDELEASPGAPPIALGDRGELAAFWQDRLNEWLALTDSATGPLVVDGWYGPNTEAATIEFQNAVEVPADGVVDPEDRVALETRIDELLGAAEALTVGARAVDGATYVEFFGSTTADASYVEDPATYVQGERVEVDGDAIVEVVLPTGIPYDGPDRLAVDDSDVVNEVVLVEDAETELRFAIGVASELPLSVEQIDGGVRISLTAG